jgi:radical SAM protein with 4Fe4S-binding SPASM domain
MLKLSGPVYCFLELTSSCDNRCPGCSNVFVQEKAHRSIPPSPPLDLADWRQVLEKLCPYVHSLRLTGGEPTRYPEFAAIVRTISELGIPFSIFTNGRWRDPAHLVSFLREIPQLRSLLISLHGSNESDHAAFCGTAGAFEETVANVVRAAQAGLRINTSTVITDHNFNDVPEIARLSLETGASHAVFSRLVGEAPCAPSPDQLGQAIREVEQLRSRGQPVTWGVCIPQCFKPNSSEGCLAGLAFWTVDPWGNVRPCNHAPLLCGNLLEQEVAEIVDSPAFASWNNLIPSGCMECAVYSRCHGGCRAQAMLLGAEKDDLIRKPLDTDPNPLPEMILPGGARPSARFEKRGESFGWLLIRGGRVQPVSMDAEPLIEKLDGSLTLSEIERCFGHEGLSLVGLLLSKGLVALEDE